MSVRLTIKDLKLLNPKINNKCLNSRGVNVTVYCLKETKELNQSTIEVFEHLQNLPFKIFVNYPEKYANQLALINNEKLCEFITSLHWFYKIRFNKNHVVPIYKNNGLKTFEEGALIFKPYGELYAAIFDLCFEIYAIGRLGNIKTDDPYLLFEKIILELRNYSLISLENIDFSSKKEDLKNEKEKLRLLRDLKNSIDIDTFPYLNSLIETSISIISTNKVCNRLKTYYKNYLKAYKKTISSLNKDFAKLMIEENIVYQVGQGNSKTVLPVKY